MKRAKTTGRLMLNRRKQLLRCSNTEEKEEEEEADEEVRSEENFDKRRVLCTIREHHVVLMQIALCDLHSCMLIWWCVRVF